MSKNRVVVTGATRGIGAEIAIAFFEAGYEVLGTRTKKNSEVNKNFRWVVADFKEKEEIEKCSDVIREYSPDVLINCAGINKISSFEVINPKDFLLIHQVNVFAPFIFCKAVLPQMKRNNYGRIVNISSIWGKIGKEYRASYMASKFALDGLTIALASEYAQRGILANCVAPGFTDTDLTRQNLGIDGMKEISKLIPSKRLAKPKEIAQFVLWLGSSENTYISGQNIAIDGGFSRV